MRPGRAQLLIWGMRLLILAMLALGLAVLYQRYQLSPEQEEWVRYVETDLAALQRSERPVYSQIESALGGEWQSSPALREQVQGEIVPALLRLRKQAEAPQKAARSRAVQLLSSEYQDVLEKLIDVCRVAVRAMDDPQLAPAQARYRVADALHQAALTRRSWQEHVQMVGQGLGMAR